MSKKLFKVYLLLVLLFAVVPQAYTYELFNYDIPSYKDVKSAWQSSDVKILASNGQTIQRIRRNFNYRSGDWLELRQISPLLLRAVIASEDKRFYSHAGVDWLASASAAFDSLFGSKTRGASTITMQLAALLDPDLQREAGGRSISKKLDQIQLAQIIELSWSKPQILEAYLNLLNFRGELLGLDMFARVLLQKSASKINLREAAITAVLLRGPNANNTIITGRACALLKDELGRPDLCTDLSFFVARMMGHSQSEAYFSGQLAEHYGRYLLKNSTRQLEVIQTDINYALQKQVNNLVHRHLVDLSNTGITDAAVVVLENKSGRVLAYIGSSGKLSAAEHVDHVLAKRQSGSTLKPFLYAQAIDQQLITAASLLNDSPVDINTGSGLYVPDNYDHVFSGWVSARAALAASLNIPAVRVLTMIGIDGFAASLNKLGLGLKHEGEYYGYSLALGSADVSLLNLSNAYRALARGGSYQPVRLPLGLEKNINNKAEHQVFSNAASWIVADILSDKQARARTFGLDSALATPFWTAVKTGTSRDMRDNWCIGWSDTYTVGVWVGNSAGASMRNVSGVTGAGPIWHDIFKLLHRAKNSVQVAMPQGVEQQKVNFAAGAEPDRTEFFLADTAQANFKASTAAVQNKGMPQIIEPVDGSTLAIDPDIAPDKQRMLMLAVDINANQVAHANWYINGDFFTNTGKAYWPVRPGVYTFELRDDFGKVIDSSKVQVYAAKIDFIPGQGQP